MRERLLAWLTCPTCRATLALTAAARVGDDLREGLLTCTGCGARYPITRGIPRMIPGGVTREARETAERFGYEWTRFGEIRPQYAGQFQGWIAPVEPGAFTDRVVLDAGCGKGRHLRLAARYGAREVIGIDLGPAVEVAARNTDDLDNVHVIQGDLTQPPLRAASMEVIYSIGVLHHLGAPVAGFRALAPLLAPGGLLVAWLYAREGNGRLLALLEPLRRITRGAPLGLVRALAWVLTVPLWLALRTVYAAVRAWPSLQRCLPYASYLVDLVPFPFREVHSIVFDQLLAPVAHYMNRGEVELCFAESGLALTSLRWHHANSWSASGRARFGGDQSTRAGITAVEVTESRGSE
jgi:SAM-dependent methyltransferase